MHSKQEKLASIGRLLDILDELRQKCPWDKKQTWQSLKNLTIEEVYELADAIDDKDPQELKKELGDVLMHIMFYAKIASESDAFDIKDVADSISDKLVFRHPHIYGDVDVESSEQVEQNWEKLKLKEGSKSVLSGVPKGLPALIKAYRIQQKASGVGFDWPNTAGVWLKIEEELNEFNIEQQNGNKANMEAEFGDILFTMVNYARHIGIDAQNALELANKKFIRRFGAMEQLAQKDNHSIGDISPEQMEEYWEKVKTKE
ncbi:nucleoside triphosphate pyrophosphohydrolase [Myroides sp. LJL115]